MDHLDLTIAEESRKAEYVLCAISGKTYINESVLLIIALVLKKPEALPVDSINIDQRAIQNTSEEDKIIFQRTKYQALHRFKTAVQNRGLNLPFHKRHFTEP